MNDRLVCRALRCGSRAFLGQSRELLSQHGLRGQFLKLHCIQLFPSCLPLLQGLAALPSAHQGKTNLDLAQLFLKSPRAALSWPRLPVLLCTAIKEGRGRPVQVELLAQLRHHLHVQLLLLLLKEVAEVD